GRNWNKLDGCLKGTQEILLSKIYAWGNDFRDEVPNIFLLSGNSGTGKSAVAHTAASFFHEQKRLGATIFLDSGPSEYSRMFFPHIIRNISKYDPAINEKVRKALSRNERFCNDPPLRQFEFIDFEVFKSTTWVGPTVIIVDGFERC
ncbi:hypothetical protein BDQ17DRAFT_1194265, partial [Cyathus striatus]